MGELLRRYWMPFAGASELGAEPIKPIRLMGEDLVLYKDLSGHSVCSTGIARTGAPISPRAGSRTTACAAPIMAG